MLRNDDMYKVLKVYRMHLDIYENSHTSFSDNELYDVINKGIDDHVTNK
jgi:hypothetical protein